MTKPKDKIHRIVLGGGCFWCIEAGFKLLPGVISVRSGYAGGHVPNPDYKSVCSGETGHAEVVEVSWDTEKLSLKALLEVFFLLHDPTSLNRQGNDIGTQYRSAIFYTDDGDLEDIQASLAEQGRIHDKPIVTEVSPLNAFYPAEDYHQDYFAQNSSQPYCQIVISPKLKKLREKLSTR